MALSSAPPLLLLLALLCSLPPLCSPESQRGTEESPPSLPPSAYPPSPQPSNATPDKCSSLVRCRKGILLPVWEPLNPGLGDKIARAVVYFVSLMYIFLGVSIIADRFMASIEVITSQVCECVTTERMRGDKSAVTQTRGEGS